MTLASPIAVARSLRRRRSQGAALVLWMLSGTASCGSDEASSPSCPVGARHCPCTPGGSCDPGLTCIDKICARVGEPDAGAAGEGAGGEAGAARGGSSGSAEGGGETAGQAGETGGSGPVVDDCRPGAELELEGSFLTEPGDFPDCNDGCSNRFSTNPFEIEVTEDQQGSEILIAGAVFDGLVGTIDGALHSPGSGPDLDLIRVKAAPRTLIEVTVEPLYEDSCLDPIVSIFDPGLSSSEPFYGFLAQNDDRAEGEIAARLVVVAPLLEDEPWFIALDDARNALASGWAGNAYYRYAAKFVRLGEASFTDLALPDLGASTTASDELVQAGDIHLYRFLDPGLHAQLVRLTASNPEMCLQIWQMNLRDGRASWTTSGASAYAPQESCSESLEFRTNSLVGGEGGEYALAVTDVFGRGSNSGLGDFGYELELVRQP